MGTEVVTMIEFNSLKIKTAVSKRQFFDFLCNFM